MRRALAAVALFALAGCGGDASAERVERCAERLLSNVAEGERTGEAEAYVRRTYCKPFEQRGWVHDDGALALDAALGDEECARAEPGGEEERVPCEELGYVPVLDCALLRHVRRGELRAYLAERPGARCDDGTPTGELGVQDPG